MKTGKTTSEPMDVTGWKRVKLPDAVAQGAVSERPRLLPRDQRGRRTVQHVPGYYRLRTDIQVEVDSLNYRRAHKRPH